MSSEAATLPRPATGVVRVNADGSAHIEGFRCGDCGGVFAEATLACRKCGSRAAPAPFKASETGTLYSWSVVERSYPGVEVPFVSAIVDLDDGLTLKGTLREVDPDAVTPALPVKLVYDDAGGATDKDGNPYVGYHFILSGDAK